MTRYSIQPRDGIFVKGCRFLSFAIKMSKKKELDLIEKYLNKDIYLQNK